MTRVPANWWSISKRIAAAATVPSDESQEPVDGLKKLHEINHFGVRRTLFLARKIWGPKKVSEQQIEAVIKDCEPCASIDPSPVRWSEGKLGVKRTWQRLAIDVAHVGPKKFLKMVDCGPGRFAIWRQIASEREPDICAAMSSVWNEFGPPEEVLLDNYSTFRGSGVAGRNAQVGIEARF